VGKEIPAWENIYILGLPNLQDGTGLFKIVHFGVYALEQSLCFVLEALWNFLIATPFSTECDSV
jgi:hypothetical protein